MNKKKNRDISVITGVFVQNENDEILFVKMPKWQDKWGIPGGHVDRNEEVKVCALRELEEETGIKADDAEFICFSESIEPEDYHKKKHFVALQYRVLVKGRPELKLEEREISEYRWMTLDEARKQDDLNSFTRKTLDQLVDEEKCLSCETYKQGWVRAQADYQNLQKEISEQRGTWIKMSELQILEEFIPVYDNFKKAFATSDTDTQMNADDADNADVKKMVNWKKGIEYIMKQFWKVLADHDIEEIKTFGEKFDTRLHEAVSEEDSDQEEGVVLREVDGGYMLKNKVIKVAKVIVSK